MVNIDVSSLKLRYAPLEVSCNGEPTPENIIRQQRIDIQVYNADKDGYSVAGYLDIGIVDVTLAINENLSVMQACDDHSSLYWELGDTLLDKQDRLRLPVQRALNDEVSGYGAIMYVEALYIQPKFRGLKLGLAALHSLMRYGSMGCESIVLKAHPFCADQIVDVHQTRKECKALRDYYTKLGFNRIGRTLFLARSLDMRLPPNPALQH